MEAGTRPQFAMVKLLWAEELQKECAGLLRQSLSSTVNASNDGVPRSDLPPTLKQAKKRAQAKQRKLKLRDSALHRTRLDAVLTQLKRTVQGKRRQVQATNALVAQVLSDLVAQVCDRNAPPLAIPSTPPPRPAEQSVRKKRKHKPKKKQNFPRVPTPPSSPLRTPPLTPLDFENPTSPSMTTPTSMFDAPGALPPPSYFDSFHHVSDTSPPFFPTTSYPPPFALDQHPDETSFFLPRLFQEDAVPPLRHNTQPTSTQNWMRSFSTLDWPHSFQWRHSETRLSTWMMEPPQTPRDRLTCSSPPPTPLPSPKQTVPCHTSPKTTSQPPLVMIDQATQATDTPEATALQAIVDSNAKVVHMRATNALQVEVAQLQHTVRELQAAVFALQQQQTKAPLPAPPPPQTTHRYNNLFVSVPTSLLPPKTKLHWDICEFVTHLQAETHSRLAAHTAVSRFCVSAVQALWPRAQAPGVLEGRNAIKETWQQHLARKLRSESWVVPESVKTIPNASIPIITLLTTAPYHVRLDISFEGPGHNGLATNDLVHSFLHELPALAPLMLVLKTFIIDRGLGVAYTGGLSSYALLLMVTRFLQEFEVGNRTCHPEAVSTQCNLIVSTQSRTDFGTMLLGFLNFYGSKFDPRQTGISVASRCFLDRDELVQHSTAATTVWHNVPMEHVQFENLNLSSPGSKRQNLHRDHWTGPAPFKPCDYDPHKFDPIYIQDPLRPGNNVGRNCFRIMQLRRALASAWSTMNLDGPIALPSNRYVGGVPLHPNNLLRSILTCTNEPKYKPHALLPLDTPGHHHPTPPLTFQHHYQPHHHPLHTQPLASPPRQMHIPRQHSATKAIKLPTTRQDIPQRRHSECVNDVQSIINAPTDDDLLRSPASARSLSFADVVVKQLQRKQLRHQAAVSPTVARHSVKDDIEHDDDGVVEASGGEEPSAIDEANAMQDRSCTESE
ncbi:hypothetical protein DYB32_002362 [Aphanomyces invadans]|uniref:Uncharacterized protein n=1 Tax=Aphanomyces invadans TaxID=157072 RepID=A0A3R6VER4_9STRA|nr:hypothetical protein DYB32_002362 [Aphanomyces invadans]